MEATTELVAGPYFEELEVGMRSAAAPGLTLTDGHAATHQAILGDRLRLPLDAELCGRVIAPGARLAHPGLVCDVAIGQSTLLTGRVVANLFYRGLALRRMPLIGDTIRTEVEVVGLRQNRGRPDRAATGLAALRIRTSDQEGRPVLDFLRCAMLPLRDPDLQTGHDDDLAALAAGEGAPSAEPVSGWRLDEYRASVPGPHFSELRPGSRWSLGNGDVVSGAPELARLTLNVAAVHHDGAVAEGRRRLVYGGQTIGLAASQLTRALPSLVTIVGWISCDHLGPVFEGDTLRSEIELERCEGLPGGGGLVQLRSLVRAEREGGALLDVLDWRLLAAMA